jgi:amino acid adenylation domain-containing protein
MAAVRAAADGVRPVTETLPGRPPAWDPASAYDVVSLFDAQADAVPEAIAVAGPADVTYAELARRSMSVAADLERHGAAGVETVVASLYPRCAELLAVMIGAWRTGAAVAPLDVGLPPGRLRALAAAAGAAVVVTAPEHASRTGFDVPVLVTDSRGRTVPAKRRYQPRLPQSLHQIAFTSGSEGVPKAVALPTATSANVAGWMSAELGLGPGDRLAWAAGPGFSVSNMELWPALCSGAAVVVVPEEAKASAPALRGYLMEHGVTAAFVVAGMAEKLSEQEWPADCRLRALFVGGEKLRKISGAVPFEIRTVYGTSETMITIASQPMAGQVPRGTGAAIPNVDARVVDDDLRACPPGEPGELVFAGPRIARGYLGRARETAEKFVPDPDPDAAVPGGRLYRTSDFAVRADGIITLLGRRDWQLNVNGLRVEPAEVESCLLAMEEVAEAAADVREFADGTQLVAFVCTAGGVPLDMATAQAHLSRHLPLRLVPRMLIQVPSLPRTPNGKLSRGEVKRLHIPGQRQSGGGDVDPRVLRIWTEELGLEPDPEAPFPALGGSSIGAMRIAVRLREELGIATTGAQVLMAGSLRDYCRELAGPGHAADGPGAAGQGGAAGAAALLPRPAEALSIEQQNLWFASRLDPTRCAYNAHLVLRLPAPVNESALAFAIQTVQERHELLRARFPNDESGRGAIVVEPVPQAVLESIRVSLAEPGLLEPVVRAFANRPYDLATGPIARFCLLDAGEAGTHLIIAMHQLVVDGHSEALVRDEICAVYDALRRSQGPRLAPVPVGYREYTRWLAAARGGPEFDSMLAAARDELEGAQRLGVLRAVPPEPDEPPGRRTRGELPAKTVADLARFSREHSVTEFAVLLGIWRSVVSKHAGVADFLIGTPLTGRDRPEAEMIVGPLVNTVPIRHRIGGPSSWSDLVRAEQAALAQAIDRGGLPFERASQVIRSGSSSRRARPLDVYFSLLVRGASPAPVLEQWEVDPERPKFGLNLQWTREDASLSMWLEHDTAVIDDRAAAALVAEYLEALGAACGDPAGRIPWVPGDAADVSMPTDVRAPAGDDGGITDPLLLAIRDEWATVLSLTPADIGPDDDFFNLGGHSLLAADAAARLEERLGVPIDLINMFECGTIGALADQIRLESPEVDSILEMAEPASVPAPHGSSGTAVAADVPAGPVRAPMSVAQEQMWLSERLTDTPTMNVPMILACSGPLDVPRLTAAFAGVTRRQESLRTSFDVAGGQAAQVIAPDVPVEMPVTDLRAAPDRVQVFRREAEALAELPFDLTTPPLFRFGVYRLADADWRVVFIAHHSIFDGASLDVLLRELIARYQDPGTSLAPLRTSYRQYSAWQRERAESGAWEPLKAYWAERLAGATRLPLPASERESGRSGAGVVSVTTMPAGVVAGLRAAARSRRVSDFMVLLAAYAVLLRGISGQEDIVIAAPSTRRAMPGADDLIGFFVNMLPLRVRVNPDERFDELLEQVRDVVLRAYAHQELPYSLILESGRRSVADLVNLPVNVGIAFYRAQRGVKMGDVTLDVVIHDYGGAFSDLEFYMLEYPDEIEVHAYGSRELMTVDSLGGYLRQFLTLVSLASGDATERCGRLWEAASAAGDGVLAPGSAGTGHSFARADYGDEAGERL